MPEPSRIIINADDLGMSETVNRSIFDQMARRQITSATMLANGDAIEAAVAEHRNYPHCSFGAHLNVSQFRPLTCDPRLAPILGDDGGFAGNRIREVKIDAPLRDAIFGEWMAQVVKLKSMGVAISHVDSHLHVHTVPALFGVLKRLQKATGVRRVRASRNLYSLDKPVGRALLLKKSIWNFALRHRLKTTTTRVLASFEDFIGVASRQPLFEQTFELMTHPGHPLFEVETKLLATPWQQQITFPVRLINYDQL